MADKMDTDDKTDGSKLTSQQYKYPDLDVKKYVRAYGARGRVSRLLLIAEHIPSHAKTALLEATREVKNCMADTDMFRYVFNKAKLYFGEGNKELSYDGQLLNSTESSCREQNNKLDGEVQRWRNLNNNDKTRLAYIELANAFETQGKFAEAFQKYMEAQEYAESHRYQIELKVRICQAAILASNFIQVKHQATHCLESMEYRMTLKKHEDGILCVCLAIYYLNRRMYPEAAQWFYRNNCVSLEKYLSNIISDEDIGLYGALTNIIYCNRGQFESRVIRNKIFQGYLAKSPKARNLVNSYHQCRYADVTKALAALDVDVRIDMYLKEQASDILSAVRGKAMVQFFSPFSAMGMGKMAEKFGVSEEDLEKELVTCISAGHIHAKIDSHNKVVFAIDKDEEEELFDEIKKMGDEWKQQTQAMLLRMS
eukprot:UN23364